MVEVTLKLHSKLVRPHTGHTYYVVLVVLDTIINIDQFETVQKILQKYLR